MQWLYTPSVLLLFLAAVAAGILAFYLWERRVTPGAAPFAMTMLLVALWAQFAALKIITVELPVKVFWNNLEYTCLILIPLGWLAFALGSTNRSDWLKSPYLIPVLLVPLISLGLLWTNPYHHLFFNQVSLASEGFFDYLNLDFSGWYWVWSIYSFFLISIGSLLLILSLRSLEELPFRRAFTIIFGCLLAWLGFGLLLVQDILFPVAILPNLAFTISGIVITMGVSQFGLKNILNLTRANVLEYIPDGVIVFDEHNQITDLNPAAAKMLNLLPQEVIGKPFSFVLSKFPDLISHALRGEETQTELTTGAGDENQTFDVHLIPLPENKSSKSGRLVVLREVTEHKKSQVDLEKSNTLLLATLEATADGILVLNGRGRSVRHNRKFLEMWHISNEAMSSGSSQDYLSYILDQLVNPAAFYSLMNKLSTQPDAESFDVLELKDGRVIERYSCPQKIGDRRVGRVWSFRDVTEQRRAEEKLRYLSTHDILTGLYNRVYFEEEINRLEKSRQFPVIVIMADVDGLKETNDQYGHQAGDVLLRHAADILRRTCRAEDMVARLGGDEFGILLPFSDVKVAENAINRIHNLLSVKTAGEGEKPISLSVGYSVAYSGDTLRKALRDADQAMYQEKATKTKSRVKTGPLRDPTAEYPQSRQEYSGE